MAAPPSSIEELLLEIDPLADHPSSESHELIDQRGVLEALRLKLVETVDDLLTHRRNYLMSLLYRIDVRESLVVDALRDLPRDEIAPRLADLIIERQLEKVRSRRTSRDTT